MLTLLLLFVRRAFLPKANNFWTTTLQQSFHKLMLLMMMFEMGA